MFSLMVLVILQHSYSFFADSFLQFPITATIAVCLLVSPVFILSFGPAILHQLQRYNRDEFLSNAEHYGSAERFLHLSIEALLDMGNHVIAGENVGVVDWYTLPTQNRTRIISFKIRNTFLEWIESNPDQIDETL